MFGAQSNQWLATLSKLMKCQENVWYYVQPTNIFLRTPCPQTSFTLPFFVVSSILFKVTRGKTSFFSHLLPKPSSGIPIFSFFTAIIPDCSIHSLGEYSCVHSQCGFLQLLTKTFTMVRRLPLFLVCKRCNIGNEGKYIAPSMMRIFRRSRSCKLISK